MAKHLPKPNENGCLRLRDLAALFAGRKGGATFQPQSTTFLTEAEERAIWKRFRYATQGITKVHPNDLAKSAGTPTKQHLKLATAPRNSSSSLLNE